jgi:hypothetical protein
MKLPPSEEQIKRDLLNMGVHVYTIPRVSQYITENLTTVTTMSGKTRLSYQYERGRARERREAKERKENECYWFGHTLDGLLSAKHIIEEMIDRCETPREVLVELEREICKRS